MKYGNRFLTPNAHRALERARVHVRRMLGAVRQGLPAIARDLRDAWRCQREGA